MTREIKLRMWDGTRHVYRNWNDRNWYDAPSPVGKCVCEAMPEDSRYEVMQFTGPKDKNGVEIYEGDIIHSSITGCNYETKFTLIGGLKFYDSKGHYVMPIHPVSRPQKTIEVIGNIHENPEQLEE